MQSSVEVGDLVRKFSELILSEAMQRENACDYLFGLSHQMDRTLQEAVGVGIGIIADIEQRAIVAAAFASAVDRVRAKLGCDKG